jgi:hypothetical protein
MDVIIPPESRFETNQVVFLIVNVEDGIYGIKCDQSVLL